MKIAIVTTPIRPKPTNFPPFGSMAIIMSLRKILPKEDVKFYNIDFHRYSRDDVFKYFEENKFDAVGISAVVSTAYEYTKFLTSKIKLIKPETKVFVGGGLAASAEILYRKAKVDYTVIGDGEIISQNLVKAIKENRLNDDDLLKIKGITFIDKTDKFKFTGYEKPLPAPLVERPDFTILDEDKSLHHFISHQAVKLYEVDSQEIKKKKAATVVVAKGCVARCTFCHRWEKGYRVSPQQSIIDHIKLLKEKYGVSHIDIGDENFGSYKEETLSLVKALKDLDLTWNAGGVRAHTINYEMLKQWKENGCQSVMFGIESGSPTMLKVMEKKITLEQNIAAIKATYDADLLTVIQLVIGMPGETDKTINETVDFLINVMDYYPRPFRNKIDFLVSTNYAQSLPGTPLYEYSREHGFIGKNIDDEEKYLLSISDKDAYDNDHFINFTKQPLLKVFSWRHLINWKTWRVYAKKYLKLNIPKHKIVYGIICMVLNKKFKLKLNSTLEKELSKFIDNDFENKNYNFQKEARIVEGLRLLFPWNKYTYPFLALIIAYKESQNIKWYFKLIFEHILWSIKMTLKSNRKLNLPEISLRKVVNITDNDETVELRKGR